MRRLAPFDIKPIGPNVDLTTECESGNVLRDLQAKFSGIYNATNAGTTASDGPCTWLGRWLVKCGSRSIIDMPAVDVRHLTAALAGCYGEISPGAIAAVPTGLTGKVLFNGMFPFGRLVPTARIDGRQEKITFRTRLGPVTHLGATAEAITGRATIVGTADDEFNDGALFFEPDFRTVEIPLAAATNNTFNLKFQDDEIVVGIMVRSSDESVRLSDPNLAKPDWMIREVALYRQKQRRAREAIVPPIGWSMLRNQQTYTYGISAATGQIHNGVGHYLFDDPTTTRQEAAFLEAQDQLTISVDTLATLEPEFDAAGLPTLEAGQDRAFVTILGFRPRGREYFQDRRGALARNGFAVL
jgi:hypothetical protein